MQEITETDIEALLVEIEAIRDDPNNYQTEAEKKITTDMISSIRANYEVMDKQILTQFIDLLKTSNELRRLGINEPLEHLTDKEQAAAESEAQAEYELDRLLFGDDNEEITEDDIRFFEILDIVREHSQRELPESYQDIPERHKVRYTNAFNDFMPFFYRKTDINGLVVETPADLLEKGIQTGSLTTWREMTQDEEDYAPEELDFYMYERPEDKKPAHSWLFMPIPDTGYSLAMPLNEYMYDGCDHRFMLLPDIEEVFVKEYKKVTHEWSNTWEEIQSVVFAPPPAILADFDVLRAFAWQEGREGCWRTDCNDFDESRPDIEYPDHGMLNFYCNNYDNEGDQVIEMAVEYSPRVWLFVKLKPEFKN